MTERIKARAYRPLPMLEREREVVYQEYKRIRRSRTVRSLASFVSLFALPLILWAATMELEVEIEAEIEWQERWDKLEHIKAHTIEIKYLLETALDMHHYRRERVCSSRCACEALEQGSL